MGRPRRYAKRVRISMSGSYLARIEGRMRTRGLDVSEVLRQFMDDAARHDAGRDFVMNKLNGELNEIAMAIDALKIRVQRNDAEAQARIRIAASSLTNVRGLLSALTPP